MERWLRATTVAEILDYKDLEKVREIMRQMVHMENPLRVTESALEAWIGQRVYRPAGTAKKETKKPAAEGRIPRRRGGKLQAV